VKELDVDAILALHGGPGGAWYLPMLVATLVGEGWTGLLLLPLLVWVRTRRFAGALALGLVVQALTVVVLKAAVGRVRPWIALGLPTPWGAPHDGSFPSGHAAGSFCVAAFLAVALPAEWPESRRAARIVAAIAVGLAAFISLSRVYLGVHFPTDVAAGALLGALVGVGAALRHRRGTDGRRAEALAGVEPPPKKS